tara:strand:+ start:37 stop:480 length:444 start_codon:yes stop_codon:yes gene_type:complete
MAKKLVGNQKKLDANNNNRIDKQDFQLLKEKQGMETGGQATSPTRPRNRKVDRGIIERGGVTPIRALTAFVLGRKEKRDERKYMDHLKQMGMFDEGGGRANVPAKKTKKRKHKSTSKPIKVADGGRVTTFKNGGAAIVKTNQKPHMS